MNLGGQHGGQPCHGSSHPPLPAGLLPPRRHLVNAAISNNASQRYVSFPRCRAGAETCSFDYEDEEWVLVSSARSAADACAAAARRGGGDCAEPCLPTKTTTPATSLPRAGP